MMMMKKAWLVFGVLSMAMTACDGMALDPPTDVIHARFDPDEGVIPLPSNVLLNSDTGFLEIDQDHATSAAEREFFGYLNGLQGWPTTFPASLEFTAPVNPASVNADSVTLLEWGDSPRLVEGITIGLSDDGTRLEIHPPRAGWTRGATYVAWVRGGSAGVVGQRGERVESDAAFYFLRLTEALDTPGHNRAFPGDSFEERVDNAQKLEAIRKDLAPYFEHAESLGIARQEIAALWSFTATERIEFAMDKESQRVPIPANLLLSPETGLVDLPPAEWDIELEAYAKKRLAEYDGFGVSAHPIFQFTGPVEPSSLAGAFTLYEVGQDLAPQPIEVHLLPDGSSVELELVGLPLREQTTYAVVVAKSVRDTQGRPIALMPLGALLASRATLLEDGASQIKGVNAQDAARAERVRAEVQPILDEIGRDQVLTAWTFTTMSIAEPLRRWIDQAATLQVDPSPIILDEKTAGQAFLDFPLQSLPLFSGIEKVYSGTIASPYFLGQESRARRPNGEHEVQNISFTLVVPKGIEPGAAVPIMIYGHGLGAENRLVLSVANQLSKKGIASISINFPFHGDRSYCFNNKPLEPDGDTSGDDMCKSGYSCQSNGKCVNAAGDDDGMTLQPIVGIPKASGAAFVELEQMPNTPDHFNQSLVDLGALIHSLKEGDWEANIGMRFDPEQISYGGQSLGGIIGSVLTAVSPEIKRAVLNVPGADVVDLFDSSSSFHDRIQSVFDVNDIDRESYEGKRFNNVARWLSDRVDPQSVAHLLIGRDAFIQRATLDQVIPEAFTRRLQELSMLPMVDYIAEHAFIAIPVEPAYPAGVRDLTDFIAGEWQP